MVAAVLALLLAASVATLALITVLILAKWRRVRADERRADAEAQLRPQLIELLSADEPDLDELLASGDQSAHHRAAIDTLALGLLAKLRGRDREVLTELLQRRGVFERARRKATSRRAGDRLLAAELLGNGAEGDVIEVLSVLLGDPRAEVRKTAARSLGKTGSAEAAPLLLSALADDRAPYSVVGMGLLHLGNGAIGQLIEALEAPEPAVRMVAADCLGVLGAVSATTALVALDTTGISPAEHRLVVRALGRIGSPAAVQSLISVMDSRSTIQVREEASIALGRIGDRSAVRALDATMQRSGDPASRAAAEGLRLSGDAGIDTLRDLLEQSSTAGSLARESLSVISRQRHVVDR